MERGKNEAFPGPQPQGSDEFERLFWTSSVSLFFVILPFRGFEFRSAAHFRWLFHVWAGGVQRWSAIPQSSILNCARAEALCQSSGFLLISFQFYLWTNIFLKIRGLMALLVYPSTVRTLSHRPRLLQLRFNRVLDRLVTSSTYSLLRLIHFFVSTCSSRLITIGYQAIPPTLKRFNCTKTFASFTKMSNTI